MVGAVGRRCVHVFRGGARLAGHGARLAERTECVEREHEAAAHQQRSAVEQKNRRGDGLRSVAQRITHGRNYLPVR